MKRNSFIVVGLLLLELLFVTIPVVSQPIDWQQKADQTFVFELSNKEALKLQQGKLKSKQMDRILTTPFASFSDEWTDKPSAGHFLLGTIDNNKVNYCYYPIIPFHVFLFKEYGVLTLQVIDMEGNVRNDAKIRMDYHTVPYDAASRTYFYEDLSEDREHLLTVELDKFRAVFHLTKNLVFNRYNSYDDLPTFYSYLVTDKNKYRPGEKIRFKSYALSVNKRPLKQELFLWLRTKGDRSKEVLALSPYHPGGYAGEFQLEDSLGLKLDCLCLLELRDKRGRVVSSTQFRYEDYELSGSKLEVELTSPTHYFPRNNQVKIVASDANGLPLQEQEAAVYILRKNVLCSYTNLLNLPDTLMACRTTLNESGQATVDIPATLFGLSDCVYEAKVLLITPDNEQVEQQVQATFYHSHYELKQVVHADSLCFSFLNGGVESSVEAQLVVEPGQQVRNIRLPYVMKFNQSDREYKFKIPDLNYKASVSMNDIESQLELEGEIDADSLKVILQNPLRLDVSWYVYQGNLLLEKGAGKELDLHIGDIDPQFVYYVEVFYFMGNQELSLKRTFRYLPNRLSVTSDLPAKIYPGQKVDATIRVEDHNGYPVPDVDLTAFSVNSQLGYLLPDLPDYNPRQKERERRSSYTIQQKKYAYSTALDYPRWNQLAHLDQLPYYQFIYPQGKLFRYVVDTPTGTTEVAPYLMKDGNSVDIYVIELNDVPCYFSWVEQFQAYSFLISHPSVKQKVTLRLADCAIVLDSILFEPGKKTILSLDIEQLSAGAKVINLTRYVDKDQKYMFSDQELNKYSKYICRLPIPENAEYACLEGDSGKWYPAYLKYALFTQGNSFLVGPVEPGYLRYMNGVTYRHEGGFAYQFEDNVVYKYPIEVCPDHLEYSFSRQIKKMNDFYLTPQVFQTRLNRFRQINAWHPQQISLAYPDGNMNFRLPAEKDSTGVANLIFEDRLSKQIYYPSKMSGEYREYKKLPAGVYDAILLYNNGKYLKHDSISVSPYHYLDVDMRVQTLHERDSLFDKWLQLEIDSLKSTSWESEFKRTKRTYGASVCGYVYSEEDGQPVVGASVIVEGTKISTITDIDGYFELTCRQPKKTLGFFFIGMKSQRINVSSNAELTVVMQPDPQMVDEVVIVGYGADVGDVLQSRVAGLAVETNDDDFLTKPLEEENSFRETEQKLYNDLMLLNGLRHNFSDVGFWQPELYTNKEGAAEFSVIFPDDITQWNTLVYAMNRKLQTGTYRYDIQSYKPVMAELKTPHFLTVGDESRFVGMIRNYTEAKRIKGQTTFTVGTDTLARQRVELEGLCSTPLVAHAIVGDSLKGSFFFARDDGYRDGEERTIPILPQGTEIQKGSLCILPENEPVKIKAQRNETLQVTVSADPLDQYENNIKYLVNYPYGCNEQLASKLVGLLGQKKIALYKGEEFKHDRKIIKLIRQLKDNQNSDQLWGWWGRDTSSSLWMTGHILEALKMAAENGYVIPLDMVKLKAEYANLNFQREKETENVYIAHALWQWGTLINLSETVRLLSSAIRQSELEEDSLKGRHRLQPVESYLKHKLLIWEMEQSQTSMADSLRKYLKEDILGGVYCSDGFNSVEGNNFYLETTLIAYRMIKNEPSLQHLKKPMQGYILRSCNHQCTTYQSAQAIATVLDDFLTRPSRNMMSVLSVLNAGEQKEIMEFPYTVQLNSEDSLLLIQKSGVPLICTTMSSAQVTDANVGKAFNIRTAFEEGNCLKVGVPVQLTVTLEVKQEGARYAMIEVPIPAACSYASKLSSFNGPEVHREYFKEKVVLFCQYLPVGEHTFQIQLLPRFTGVYSLNPAKVELMYFPVVVSNNELRSVQVVE